MAGLTQINGNWQIETGSITNADLAHSTFNVTAGSGMGGGGTASLGGSITVTANVTNGANVFNAVQTVVIAGIGITSTDGLFLVNNTAATNSVTQQWSPRLHWRGYQWLTASSTSMQQDFAVELQTMIAGPLLVFSGGTALTGLTDIMGLDSFGNLTLAGVVNATGLQVNSVATRSPLPSSTFNLYVNGSTGNDSNSGLSSGAAKATIQAAVNLISGYDTGSASNVININVAAGTYSAANTLPTIVGAAAVNIVGAGSGSVTCTSTTGNVFSATSILGTWALSGMTLTTSGSGSGAVYCTGVGGCIQILSDIVFGALASGGNHLFATNGGQIQLGASYTISGGCNIHMNASNMGTIVSTATSTVTVSANISITIFAQAVRMGFIYTGGITYSSGVHTVTGTRYSANTTALIDTLGGGASYFPGTIGGSVATQGLYA